VSNEIYRYENNLNGKLYSINDKILYKSTQVTERKTAREIVRAEARARFFAR